MSRAAPDHRQQKGEADNNLYLPRYSEGVTIRGDLDQTADIRVTTENKPSKNSTVTIAKKAAGSPEP